MDLNALASARVVDLSLTVSERLPGTWPGHMTYAHHNWNWFAKVEGPTGKTRSAAPYQTNFVVMDEHCGTHFDAPTHFVPPEGSGLPLAGPLGAQTGNRVPLEDLMGPAAVVDVRSLAERGEPVYPARSRPGLGSRERTLAGAGGRALPDGLGPLLRRGCGGGEVHAWPARHGRVAGLACAFA